MNADHEETVDWLLRCFAVAGIRPFQHAPERDHLGEKKQRGWKERARRALLFLQRVDTVESNLLAPHSVPSTAMGNKSEWRVLTKGITMCMSLLAPKVKYITELTHIPQHHIKVRRIHLSLFPEAAQFLSASFSNVLFANSSFPHLSLFLRMLTAHFHSTQRKKEWSSGIDTPLPYVVAYDSELSAITCTIGTTEDLGAAVCRKTRDFSCGRVNKGIGASHADAHLHGRNLQDSCENIGSPLSCNPPHPEALSPLGTLLDETERASTHHPRHPFRVPCRCRRGGVSRADVETVTPTSRVRILATPRDVDVFAVLSLGSKLLFVTVTKNAKEALNLDEKPEYGQCSFSHTKSPPKTPIACILAIDTRKHHIHDDAFFFYSRTLAELRAYFPKTL